MPYNPSLWGTGTDALNPLSTSVREEAVARVEAGKVRCKACSLISVVALGQMHISWETSGST